MENKLLLISFLLFGILFSGCTENNSNSNQTQFQEVDYLTCNEPYIKNGYSCCLDYNKNNICDSDENIKVSSISIEDNLTKETKNEINDNIIDLSIINYTKIRLTNNWNPEFEYFIDDNNNVYWHQVNLDDDNNEIVDYYLWNFLENKTYLLLENLKSDTIKGISNENYTILQREHRVNSENYKIYTYYIINNNKAVKFYSYTQNPDRTEKPLYFGCIDLYGDNLICFEDKLIKFTCDENAEDDSFCENMVDYGSATTYFKLNVLNNNITYLNEIKESSYNPQDFIFSYPEFISDEYLSIECLGFGTSFFTDFFMKKIHSVPNEFTQFYQPEINPFSAFCGVYDLKNNELIRTSKSEKYLNETINGSIRNELRNKYQFHVYYPNNALSHRYMGISNGKGDYNSNNYIFKSGEYSYSTTDMKLNAISGRHNTNIQAGNQIFNGEYLVIADTSNADEFDKLSKYKYTDLYLIKFNFKNLNLKTKQFNYDLEKLKYKSVSSENNPLVNSPELYLVKEVVDGDTIKVDYDGKETTIRLIGVNTPEIKNPIECYGKEASDYTKSILENKKIKLEFDETQGKYDIYNRLLAYVILEDNINFNSELIKNGFAYEYTYNTKYKYSDKFKTAQIEAEHNNKGLWSENTCNGSLSFN